MFPGLPSDPPVAESAGILALLLLAICVVIIIAKRLRGSTTLPRPLVALVLFALVVASGAAATVAARNTGRWGELKQELVAFEKIVTAYEAAHGVINSQEAADQFYRLHHRTFSFNRTHEVELIYFWRHDPRRVGIALGRGSAAAFDLSTMICVYTE